MTAFIALIRKDILLYLGDRRALMMHLLMPVVLAAFFGSLFGGSGDSQHGRIDIALVQQDTSPIAAQIGKGLLADPNLQVALLALDQARDAVRKGKVAAAVVIPAGFGDAAGRALFGAADKPELPVFYDPSQGTVLAMVKGLLTQQVMQSVSAEMFSGPTGRKVTEEGLQQLERQAGATPDDAALGNLLKSVRAYQVQHAATPADGKAAGKGGLSMPYTTHDEAVSSGPKYNSYAHSFAGMGVQFILFMGVDLGIGILLAQRMGIWNRLLAAPVPLHGLLLARAVSGAIIAFCLMVVLFLAGVLIFRVEITNPAGFVLIALCFAVMTAAFGLLIAAFGKTPEAARGMAIFATMILVMLGGAWVPSFIFPQWLQSATLVVPTRWAVDGFDAMTWRGLGLDVALRCALVQLGFAVAFGALALWKFRADGAK